MNAKLYVNKVGHNLIRFNDENHPNHYAPIALVEMRVRGLNHYFHYNTDELTEEEFTI